MLGTIGVASLASASCSACSDATSLDALDAEECDDELYHTIIQLCAHPCKSATSSLSSKPMLTSCLEIRTRLMKRRHSNRAPWSETPLRHGGSDPNKERQGQSQVLGAIYRGRFALTNDDGIGHQSAARPQVPRTKDA